MAWAGHRGEPVRKAKCPHGKKKEIEREVTPQRLPPPAAAAYRGFKARRRTRGLILPRKVALSSQGWFWRDLRFCDPDWSPALSLNPVGGTQTRDRSSARPPNTTLWGCWCPGGNMRSQAKLISPLRGPTRAKGGKTFTTWSKMNGINWPRICLVSILRKIRH